MDDCLFCKIVAGDIPADKVFENNNICAFRDIDPKAPTHILIIPKEHISTMNDLDESHKMLVGEIMLTAKEIAGQDGIADSGYRTVFNCNQDGGQAVYHIHLHLLGGRHMNWPPG